MTIPIAINVNNYDKPEVEIIGGKDGYLVLSKEMTLYDGPEIIFSLKEEKNNFYPESVTTLILRFTENSNGLTNLTLENKTFIISGDKLALTNLSETIYNLSNSEIGTHFHIDYYEDNGIVSETNIALVLMLTDNL